MKTFLNILENIGKDVIKGVEVAAPIISKFGVAIDLIPGGPILVEIASVITALEQKNANLTQDELSQIVQVISHAHAIKLAAGK